MESVNEAAGGAQGMLRLAHAWHERVMADEVVSHAFSHGLHPHHSERLAAYWAEALGGPANYSDHLGTETTVVRNPVSASSRKACLTTRQEPRRAPPERLSNAPVAVRARWHRQVAPDGSGCWCGSSRPNGERLEWCSRGPSRVAAR